MKKLKKEKVEFEVWENKDTCKIVEYLDSKIGFREILSKLSKQSSQIMIPINL